MNSLYEMIVSEDMSPTLIGILNDAEDVTIMIFDQNGVEIKMPDDKCSQIWQTGRWSWSTINLPGDHFGPMSYKMVANNGEVFEGEFTVHEGGL